MIRCGEPAGDRVVEQTMTETRSHTLVEEVATSLRARIASGEIAPGERLPPERVLVAELGISRTVLREALSSLEALGLVEARTTRGRYVAVGGSSRHSSVLVGAWLHQHATQIAEIDEIRAVIEEQAIRGMDEADARDAAERARPLLAEQQDAVARGAAFDAAACDAQFHRLLCAYTRNAALRSLAEGLVEQMRRPALAVYSIGRVALASLDQHRAIVEALAAGDVEVAARLAREHMRESARLPSAS